jgi:hypothetical protein
MTVLDGVDPKAAAHQFGNQLFHQGRLAGILPADDTEDTLAAQAEIRSALA